LGSASVDLFHNRNGFSNDVLEVTYQLNNNNLTITSVKDKIANSVDQVTFRELFIITITNTVLVDTNMVAGTPVTERIEANPDSYRVRERFDGWKLSIPFTYTSNNKKFSLLWITAFRDGSNYINHELTFTSDIGDWDLRTVQMVDITSSGLQKAGGGWEYYAGGTPAYGIQFFIGQEVPTAQMSDNGKKAYVSRSQGIITKQGETFKQTAAIGVYPDNQFRRGFQYYLERERICEHKPFLHYNTWWDLNGSILTQNNIINRIDAFGSELITKRGVALIGFMVDDGYDDINVNTADYIWELNPNRFPGGIDPLKTAAAKYPGAYMGFWMSPTGGYFNFQERVTIAKKENPNVETTTDGHFKVYGPNSYQVFKNAMFRKIDNDVRSFKFDNVGNPEDAYALARLSVEARERNPNIFINATIGTWGSPYFAWFFDSWWRTGMDAHNASYDIRDIQVTYRDYVAMNNIRANPTVPLNSLMVHGIGHGQSYQGKTYSHTPDGELLDMNDPANLQDFREEIADYFSQGFNLQELYITPTLMTQGCWDVLAEGANWAHANHDVLLDAHFIGANLSNSDCGQYGNGDVYGVASWSESKAILMLRNPSYNTVKTITLNPDQAFDIPPYYDYNKYTLTDSILNVNPGAPIAWERGADITFTVQPRSILLYEAIPYGNTPANPNQASPLNNFYAKVYLKNSVHKAIQVNFGKMEEDVEACLISANGRIIVKNRAGNTKQMLIDIENIGKGVYFLRLSSKHHTLVKKICIGAF